MNLKLLITAFFLSLSINVIGQMTVNGKPPTDEQKKMFKEAITPQNILSKTAVRVCQCIDSISIANKNAKENASEIKKCIDKQVIGYQSSLKLRETVDAKPSENVTVTIYTNPESNQYLQYFYEIQTQVMDSCKAVKNVVGMNNKNNGKSISIDSTATKEYYAGNDLLKSGDYQKALPFYERAVKIDPTFAFAWDNIGVCNRKLGNLDKALKAYQTSLKLDPNGTTPLQNIALVYVGKKEFQKAIKCYENLANIQPDNPEAPYGIATIYYESLLDNEKALDYMCKAFILYTQQDSPYRSDAEKIINSLHSTMKKAGKESDFNKILEIHKLSRK